MPPYCRAGDIGATPGESLYAREENTLSIHSARWRYNLVYFGALTKVVDRNFDPPYIVAVAGCSNFECFDHYAVSTNVFINLR